MTASAPTLSVVIPSLDAAATLPAGLAALAEARARGLLGEVIIAEAGDSAATGRLAAAADARVIASPVGRGLQLQAGAEAAGGDWLLFLHADTVLQSGWSQEVAGFLAGEGADRRAAVFRFALDDPAPQARHIERLANWRSRRLGLPYGDQGLLISRRLYDHLGGFRPLALMEDVDILRRLVRRQGRHNLVMLDAAAVTSAVRYRRGGWLLRPLRNLSILSLYFAGAPPRLLARLYG
ncbi:glycosyltransferase [Pelagibius litoralis]|uniref:Glycosyltransferase n=1 Tax=Pelagibius litoralis TaxID=374515 RepID=A0A967F1W6_9PROT|nr:TIGR04283 family arsenosugar biosynthesis glycosyltransferase [Pelagibius litoralis]NIA71604.1 glycosyltransferase [Pelagibius litoralis]